MTDSRHLGYHLTKSPLDASSSVLIHSSTCALNLLPRTCSLSIYLSIGNKQYRISHPIQSLELPEFYIPQWPFLHIILLLVEQQFKTIIIILISMDVGVAYKLRIHPANPSRQPSKRPTGGKSANNKVRAKKLGRAQCANAKGGSETKQNNRFCFGFSPLDFGQLTTTSWVAASHDEHSSISRSSQLGQPQAQQPTKMSILHVKKKWQGQKVLSFIITITETNRGTLKAHRKVMLYSTELLLSSVAESASLL